MNMSILFDNLPKEKFFTGFFDEICENETDSKFFLVGKLIGLNASFYSEFYGQSTGVDGMIENGEMNPNGLLIGETPAEIPTKEELL